MHAYGGTNPNANTFRSNKRPSDRDPVRWMGPCLHTASYGRPCGCVNGLTGTAYTTTAQQPASLEKGTTCGHACARVPWCAAWHLCRGVGVGAVRSDHQYAAFAPYLSAPCPAVRQCQSHIRDGEGLEGALHRQHGLRPKRPGGGGRAGYTTYTLVYTWRTQCLRRSESR